MNEIQQTLPELASRIATEHQECLASAKDAITKAIEVGRLLTEAKRQAGHGQWAAWVEANCEFRPRQASSYMRAWENRNQIGSGASDLASLRGVVEALAEPRPAIRIDPEFANILPKHRPHEFAGLEKDIVEHGLIVPIAVWAGRNILLDGHARLAICQKHGIPFEVEEIELETRQDAINWIVRRELFRKHYTDEERAQIEIAIEAYKAREASRLAG